LTSNVRRARDLHLLSVGNRTGNGYSYALAAPERELPVIGRLRLDAVDAQLGTKCLCGGRATGDEAAAADADEQDVERPDE
jgi:hypothetical protein